MVGSTLTVIAMFVNACPFCTEIGRLVCETRVEVMAGGIDMIARCMATRTSSSIFIRGWLEASKLQNLEEEPGSKVSERFSKMKEIVTGSHTRGLVLCVDNKGDGERKQTKKGQDSDQDQVNCRIRDWGVRCRNRLYKIRVTKGAAKLYRLE